MSEISVQLPDGSTRTLPEGTNGAGLAAGIGRRLAKDALAVQGKG